MPVANARAEILLMDGATGTELGRRGVNISLPLWSARALLEAPLVLESVHRDYLLAGADAITANTFRTHERSLAKVGMGDRASELTNKAVEIARRVRDEVKPSALVLGSVAPLEDCYQPQLAPDATACAAEHRRMIQLLLEAGVDRILIETMNNARESQAAAEAAQDLGPGKWMISFCTKSHGPPGILLSGESLADLLPALEGASSIGINCVAAPATESQVKLLHLLTGGDAASKGGPRLSAYANIASATADGHWIATDASDPEVYAQYAARWVAAGATIIGGCCGTNPQTIRAIADHLGRR